MTKTILSSTLLVLACVFVQSTWLGSVELWGVRPDLALLVLVWVSYKNGPVEGPFTGFISGLVEDCLSSSPLGFHAFMKTLVAWLSSLLHSAFAIDRIVLPLLLGAAATLGKAGATTILAALFRGGLRAYDFLSPALWVEVGYNALLSPPLFLLLRALSRFLVTSKEKR